MARKRKKRDFTFRDPDGEVWDSKFEWLVYNGLRDQGYMVARCDERDSLAYHSPIKTGRCLECDGTSVVTERRYTPDFRVVEPEQPSRGLVGRRFIVECKGYFPAQRRTLLRCVKECHPDVDLRFIFPTEVKLTPARTNVEYVLRMIKCPATAWNNGAFEWRYPK